MADDYEQGLISAIRALGFVGNSHYCPGCLNHFHVDRGQHEPDCSVLADMNRDDEWWTFNVGLFRPKG